jgi:hypothetical protein
MEGYFPNEANRPAGFQVYDTRNAGVMQATCHDRLEVVATKSVTDFFAAGY